MYVEREIKKTFDKIITSYSMVAVVGARQAGKTTFLKQQMSQGKSIYILFDDPDVRGLFDEDLKKFEQQYLEGNDLAVLDEVQSCKDAGRKLKYLVDSGRRLWITSSSEVILAKEILSYLVGRISILRLYPFSYEEFLTAKGQKKMTAPVALRMMWEHMQYGGYPKVVLTDDPELKETILQDLYETMLLKDVARTFSIDDIDSLEKFARYLAVGPSGILSYDTVSNALGISFRTIKKYLDAMEKSYFIIRVYPYFSNKRKEIVKQPKVYFIDTGLRNIIAKTRNKEPDGMLFENYVCTELLKCGILAKYWRTKTKTEVDFIVEKSSGVVPLEVKLHAEPGKIERGLRSFIEMYHPKNALVVTYKGTHGQMKVNGCTVSFTDVAGMQQQLIEMNNVEPQLRPEYIKKIKKIQQSGNYTEFSSIKQLRDEIENKKKRPS